ncbi:MAG TPA: hypothetical protein VFR84_18920 [Candidatus Angelobacter sp.]|nr:hypothetical protein [Candidatus Angelobacter sp.]
MPIAYRPKLSLKATMPARLARMSMHAILVSFAGAQLVLSAIGCSSASAPKPQPSAAAETKAAPAPEKPASNWTKDEKANVMDNTKEISLVTSAVGDVGGTLLIRFKGKQLDAYVATKEVVDDERAGVRIKFDDGDPARQVWGRSTDYRAVFSPDPVGLITKLETSKKFYIEYHPYQKVAETIIFDVSGLEPLLPQAEMAVHKQKWEQSNAANAALRARILPYVHPCKRKEFIGRPVPPGSWCWVDPDDVTGGEESAPWSTKEGALQNALDLKRLGLNFKNR